ncbi:MAG: hypothetical protein U0610_01435 [bacterium]
MARSRSWLAVLGWILALAWLGSSPSAHADDAEPAAPPSLDVSLDREGDVLTPASFDVDPEGSQPSPLVPPAGKPLDGSLWDDWNELLERRTQQVLQREGLWRNTAVPLKGMLLVQYKYKTIQVKERFNGDGVAGPTLAPVDVFGGKLDFGLTGTGEGHTFQFFYGLTDRITLFAEQPFGRLTPAFHVRYTPPDASSPTSTASLLDAILPQLFPEDFTDSLQNLEGLWQAIELFGRPRPNTEEVLDDIQVGDFTFGIGADYLRTDHLGLAAAVKVVAPTGHLASPNDSLIFALGPELDIGVGSWGFQGQQWIDWRFPEPLGFLSWTLELGYQYYLPTDRKSPTNFTEPVAFRITSQEKPVLAALFRSVLPPSQTEPLAGGGYAVHGTLIDVLQAVDPSIAKELAPVFPDLSGLGKTYRYTPGSQFAAQLQASYSLFGVGLAGGSVFNWTESASIEGNVPEFAEFVDAVQLVAESWRWAAWGKVSVPLLPLKIPAIVASGIEFQLKGKNAFVYEDNIEVTCGIILPWFFPE